MRFDTGHILRNADQIFHRVRWANGIVFCPFCGCIEVRDCGDYHYRCRNCGNRFSDRTRTVMQGSRLSTSVWVHAAYEMILDNFISSTVLAKKIGTTQKTAWHIQSKIRYRITLDEYKLTGEIAQDEAYLGGCLSYYHYGRKQALLRSMGLMGENDKRHTKSAIFALNSRIKTPIFGMNDGEKVILYETPNPIRREYLHHIYKKHVVGDSYSVSDESKLYEDWEEKTGHKIYTNNHHNNQYQTKEGYSSNRIENTFSRLKSGYRSRVTHSKYTQLYLNEFCFRMNTRHMDTQDRLDSLLTFMCGGAVTYDMIRHYDPLSQFTIKKKPRRHIYTEEDIRKMFENSDCIEYIQIGQSIYYRKDYQD